MKYKMFMIAFTVIAFGLQDVPQEVIRKPRETMQ